MFLIDALIIFMILNNHRGFDRFLNLLTYFTSIQFLDVSVLAGINTVTGAVAVMVLVVGIFDALLVRMVVVMIEFVTLEFVSVVFNVAVLVAVLARICADFLLSVSICATLVVSVGVCRIVERQAGVQSFLVGLIALPGADVGRSGGCLDRNNKSDKKFHFLYIFLFGKYTLLRALSLILYQ